MWYMHLIHSLSLSLSAPSLRPLQNLNFLDDMHRYVSLSPAVL